MCHYSRFPWNSLNFIFIDGDHRYSQAIKDIKSAFKKLKPKGILCGHDCEGRMEDFDEDFINKNSEKDWVETPNGKWAHCGVVKAVNEAFKEYNLDTCIWYIYK